MDNNVYLAIITGLLFFSIKFVEKRFIKKETLDFKIMFRDSLLVAGSSLLANFVFKQFSILVTTKTETPSVFVNEPDF